MTELWADKLTDFKKMCKFKKPCTFLLEMKRLINNGVSVHNVIVVQKKEGIFMFNQLYLGF